MEMGSSWHVAHGADSTGAAAGQAVAGDAGSRETAKYVGDVWQQAEAPRAWDAPRVTPSRRLAENGPPK